jgi:23S rRNA (adenine2503-C2)-methyltransferase
MSLDQLQAWCEGEGLPRYRAGQVWRWVFGRRAAGFGEMTDLPRALRSRLEETFTLFTTEVLALRQADDGTRKLLLELVDGERTECVLLSDDRHHRTACISTQVGCAMGCAFCASGLDGLVRNLSAGEIIEQLLQLARLLKSSERLSHVVVMGMGEPLANLDNVLTALETATAPDGLGIGARRVTISTVGLPGGMRHLAEHDAPYHLAVSLHAPDDRLRAELVPSGRGVPIASILAAADDYFAKTGRRVTYEYVLLAGVNDQPAHAEGLGRLLQGRPAMVNVIPLNPVPELPFHTPSAADTTRFVELLRGRGLNAQVRFRKGEGIDAACGQLRRSSP